MKLRWSMKLSRLGFAYLVIIAGAGMVLEFTIIQFNQPAASFGVIILTAGLALMGRRRRPSELGEKVDVLVNRVDKLEKTVVLAKQLPVPEATHHDTVMVSDDIGSGQGVRTVMTSQQASMPEVEEKKIAILKIAPAPKPIHPDLSPPSTPDVVVDNPWATVLAGRRKGKTV